MPLFRINGRVVFFVHVPKTGGTSVENTLASVGQIALHQKPFPGWVAPQHWHAEVYGVTVPREFYDYAFLVHRNPYLRLISEFRRRAKSAEIAALGFDAWCGDVLTRYPEDMYMLSNHIRPQVEFTSKGVDRFAYEEGLQRVIDRVAQKCELSKAPAIRRDNVPKSVSVSVSEATLARIATFYRADFREFGYDDRRRDDLVAAGVAVR